MNIKGKKVLITGASSGIGAAIAKHFASKGCFLLLAGRNQAELNRVKSECSSAKGVEIYLMDLEKHEALIANAQNILSKHPDIDILINNAGVSQRALAKDLPFEYDKKIIDIDLLGTIALTKTILPFMLERKSGSIVTITSMMGKFSTPLRSAYAAAKHGLHGFFDALRSEVIEDGIQILLVCPGFIKTNVSINALGPKGKSQGTMDKTINNGLNPKEVAIAIEKGIENNSEEINVAGGKEMFGLYMKRFAPSIFSKMIRKMEVV
jgi:dehydrogenase/reductase SDR family protein 7B